MGHVVWRWKILSGESLEPTLILLLGLFFFFKQNRRLFIVTATDFIMSLLVLFTQPDDPLEYKQKTQCLESFFYLNTIPLNMRCKQSFIFMCIFTGLCRETIAFKFL